MTFLYIKYYQKKVSKNACERYQSLSEEEKNKKPEYARDRYRNLPEDEKERLGRMN